jgi:hypothetical protein
MSVQDYEDDVERMVYWSRVPRSVLKSHLIEKVGKQGLMLIVRDALINHFADNGVEKVPFAIPKGAKIPKVVDQDQAGADLALAVCDIMGFIKP